jgi:TIGR03009 family protein
MAIRPGCSRGFIVLVVLAVGARILSAQNAPMQPNPVRNGTAGTTRQPVDSNLLRGQQAGPGLNSETIGQPGLAAASGNQPANGGPAEPQILPVAPPFQLSAQEQADLDVLLKNWERQSEQIKYFKCSFNRWEYNPTFVGGNAEQPTTESHGEIKFHAPDQGMFRVLQMFNFIADPKTKKFVKQQVEPTEWWTCDGKSMFQVDSDKNKKVVIERPLPPQLQGTAITDGPLPFVFGAKAEALKKRYFLRIITPADNAKQEVWLEARPKVQKDAANFSRVQLIFDKANMQLQAMQIYNPGASPQNQSRTVITFDQQSINSPWAPLAQLLSDFSRPNPPFYTHVREDVLPPPNTPSASPSTSQPGSQASRTQSPRR